MKQIKECNRQSDVVNLVLNLTGPVSVLGENIAWIKVKKISMDYDYLHSYLMCQKVWFLAKTIFLVLKQV